MSSTGQIQSQYILNSDKFDQIKSLGNSNILKLNHISETYVINMKLNDILLHRIVYLLEFIKKKAKFNQFNQFNTCTKFTKE